MSLHHVKLRWDHAILQKWDDQKPTTYPGFDRAVCDGPKHTGNTQVSASFPAVCLSSASCRHSDPSVKPTSAWRWYHVVLVSAVLQIVLSPSKISIYFYYPSFLMNLTGFFCIWETGRFMSMRVTSSLPVLVPWLHRCWFIPGTSKAKPC